MDKTDITSPTTRTRRRGVRFCVDHTVWPPDAQCDRSVWRTRVCARATEWTPIAEIFILFSVDKVTSFSPFPFSSCLDVSLRIVFFVFSFFFSEQYPFLTNFNDSRLLVQFVPSSSRTRTNVPIAIVVDSVFYRLSSSVSQNVLPRCVLYYFFNLAVEYVCSSETFNYLSLVMYRAVTIFLDTIFCFIGHSFCQWPTLRQI